MMSWCSVHGVSYVVGPSKTALKAMLVNLDNDDSIPPLQSGSLSPPAHAASSGLVDIHAVDGKFENLIIIITAMFMVLSS